MIHTNAKDAIKSSRLYNEVTKVSYSKEALRTLSEECAEAKLESDVIGGRKLYFVRYLGTGSQGMCVVWNVLLWDVPVPGKAN